MFQFPTGWNSTIGAAVNDGSENVSIPNGMEFYDTAELQCASKNKGFNSQRDEILQNFAIAKMQHVAVSIPNGMEFYKVGCEKWHKRQMSFNSQRDGILPKP